MKPPATYTYWDPSQGKYVTIPAEAVIKPPNDDAEFRRKSVMAVDAVVSSAMSGIMKGFLWALAVVILLVILCNVKDTEGVIPGVFLFFVFAYLIYRFVRAAVKGK